MVKSHVSAPAVYLKHFYISQNSGRSSVVKAYNKRLDRIQSISVAQIGAQHNFFSDNIEDFNNAFESKYDKAIDYLTGPKANITDTIDRDINIILIACLSNFLARNKDTMEFYKQLIRQNTTGSFTDQELHEYAIPLLTDRSAVKATHNVVIIETERNMLTSDNPIITFPHPLGRVILLPLTFNLLCIMTNSKDLVTSKEMTSWIQGFWRNIDIIEFNRFEFKNAGTFVVFKENKDIQLYI